MHCRFGKRKACYWNTFRNMAMSVKIISFFRVSDMTKALVEDEAFTQWLCKRTPAARWGNPEELIGAAVYLSSRASDFVNGHLLFVDGGMLVAV